MCGVQITLSMVSNGWCGSVTGSSSNTSTAAMPGRPARSAATRAPGAISPARLVLTRIALGLHATEIIGADNAARRGIQPEMQRHHVAVG